MDPTTSSNPDSSTNVKHYCHICEKTFATSGNLHRHVNAVNNVGCQPLRVPSGTEPSPIGSAGTVTIVCIRELGPIAVSFVTAASQDKTPSDCIVAACTTLKTYVRPLLGNSTTTLADLRTRPTTHN